MNPIAIISILLVFTLSACDKKPSGEPFVPTPRMSETLPPGHPPVNSSGEAATLSGEPESVQTQTATVVSTIDIPQFTYLEVTQNKKTRWLASATITAKKGDVIQFDNGSTMESFTSNALDRTFPSMTFVNNATIVKGK